ncbi:hypothetical protein [Sphingomonas cavernae]|uniref:Uncharacterized protein n=1 Tax=Sphingomonas cavernae TaxID=2320861 RepID=A0A418W5X5_9SPHN|nr:hypothetical protein [Sphingomonas cavernae]RJF85435.1 hypothetical protein D3876_15960 [Sphingomonas cavernae]
MMAGIKAAAVAVAAFGMAMAAPASAQIFLKSPNFTGARVTGAEPGVMLPLPGARPEELRAAMVWGMRAGLNVAALQCQFAPTLLTLNQYNYILSDHSTELAKAYDTLHGYFKRHHKNAKAALTALDQYGTRTYLGFSTVHGQLGFCLTASRIGSAAMFAPKNGLGELASERMMEFRNSLKAAGEQQFPRFLVYDYREQPPRLDNACWDRKNTLKKSCRAG